MKFRELISAFGSEAVNLRTVLAKDSWRKYRLPFEDLEAIIEKKHSEMLDAAVPFQLAKEVSELSKLEFFLYYTLVPHQLTTEKRESAEAFEIVSASDILYRFGGHVIGEAIERGMSEVVPRQIGNYVEVLGVYELTNIGMLASLRTEMRYLTTDELLVSFDGQRKWIILDEPFMILDPYSAQEKKDHQKKQGIRTYRILPLEESGRPQETELLMIKGKRRG